MSEAFDTFLQLAGSTIRVSTPLLFAALGGLFSERSGVVNIALEGLMLVGAFAAAVVAVETGSPWAGAAAGAGAGLALSALYGFSVIRLRADQIVAGTAINLLAIGSTPFISKILYGVTTSTPALPVELRFTQEPVWAAWGLLLLTAWALRSLPIGIWIRFAGEKPAALDAAGRSVTGVRWVAVMTSGVLAGLGGASLSIALASSFSRNMTAGRGFMALAALIFGKWKPIPTAIACLFFGFADAMQIRLQGVILWGEEPVPVQFIQILPYLVTVLVLAGFVGLARAPLALGTPYRKG